MKINLHRSLINPADHTGVSHLSRKPLNAGGGGVTNAPNVYQFGHNGVLRGG